MDNPTEDVVRKESDRESDTTPSPVVSYSTALCTNYQLMHTTDLHGLGQCRLEQVQ